MASDDTGDRPAVSAFRPHHTTTVEYPDFSIMHDIRKDIKHHLLLPPRDARNRYEPRPLVPHDAVTAHTDRCNDAEASLYSMTPATATSSDRPRFRPRAQTDDADRLEHDMRVVTNCPGETTLAAITYHIKVPSGRVRLPVIAIVRSTRLVGEGGREDGRAESLYEMALECLPQLEKQLPDSLWLANLMDAIERRSDRAVLHVRNQLEKDCPQADGVEDVKIDWKPGRVPAYADHFDDVSSVLRPARLAPDSTLCDICGETYDDALRRPRRLECGHILCEACLRQWCESRGPAHATDPQCRHRIFNDRTARELQFGSADREYHVHKRGNDRYTSWENFERSCADLDIDWMENMGNRVVLTLSPDIITVIGQYFNYFVEQAKLEPATSTPAHLQPAHAPELDDLYRVLGIHLDKLAMVKIPASVLFHDIMNEFYRDWYHQFFRSNMHSSLKHYELRRLSKNPSAKALGLRPDLDAFVRRVLNRTLVALTKRRLKPGEEAKGSRQYYVAEGPWIETRPSLPGELGEEEEEEEEEEEDEEEEQRSVDEEGDGEETGFGGHAGRRVPRDYVETYASLVERNFGIPRRVPQARGAA